MATYRLDFDDNGDPVLREEDNGVDSAQEIELDESDVDPDWENQLRRELINAGIAA